MQDFINGLPIAAVILLLLAGFAFLVKGADLFVEGSSSIARKLKVPPIIIGLTIVAMGTSLPETAVSVTASMVQNNELAVSNVVGSNIFNLMFVIGVCSMLTPIMVQKVTLIRDIPLSFGCALLLLVLGILGIGDKTGMTLGHIDGIVFLIIFAAYIFTMVQSAMKARAAGQKVEIEGVEACETKELSYAKSILFLIVGLTIVSIGTSLPELVTSIVAARKNEVDMAVGNAVGSNIFNILMVLGISATISPVALLRENIIDIIILMIFTVLVWLFAGTKRKISRKEGIIMALTYLVYCGYIIIR